MSSPDFSSVAILGPGLLGGSLAKALQSRRPDLPVHLWARREEALDGPRRERAASRISTDLPEILDGADLVILCTPVTVMPELAQRAAPFLRPGCLVTDVGSVKGWLQKRIPPLLPKGAEWLGSHPMAGKETSGYEASSADLFLDTITLLTPAGTSSSESETRLRSFWQSVGCRILTLTPEEHDLRVAHVSHVPHLLSAVLMNSTPEEALTCAGPGFLSMTRIAAGPAELWESIFVTNRDAVILAMKSFHDHWGQSSGLISEGEFDKLTRVLELASARRRDMTV